MGTEYKLSYAASEIDQKLGKIDGIEGDVSKLSAQIADYLPKNQGTANAGKILVVGADGNVTLANMPISGGDVVGTLDANNNIYLTGDLAEGTYSIKFEYEDGTVAEIGSFTIGTDKPAFINLANPSDANWMTNKRYNSSGVLTDVTDAQRGTDTVVITNLVDITSVNTLHLKALDIMNKTNGGQNYGRVYLYDDTGAYVFYNQPSGGNVAAYSTASYDANVMLIDVASLVAGCSYKLGSGRTFKYFSFGGILKGTAEDVIITADRQIV